LKIVLKNIYREEKIRARHLDPLSVCFENFLFFSSINIIYNKIRKLNFCFTLFQNGKQIFPILFCFYFVVVVVGSARFELVLFFISYKCLIELESLFWLYNRNNQAISQIRNETTN
jgi:hypothetical protein